jgi:hypothetical protein
MSAATDQSKASLFIPALLYIFVPSVLVLFHFSEWPKLAVLATGLAGILLYPQAREGKGGWLALFSGTWPYLILAAGIVWLSGVLPPFAENTDWRKHYALFNALVDQPWPPKFITGDGVSALRYSLGFYVVPALAAKWLGTWALSFAIFAWCTFGCYLGLVLAFGDKPRSKLQCFLIGTVFLLFSGADIVGAYLVANFPKPPMPFMHFEWWSGFGAFPSAVTSIFWTPQHLIAGWVGAFLFIRYPLKAVRSSGLIVCAAALWSPFIAIGLIPCFAWAVWTTSFRELLTKLNFVVAPVLLLISAQYLGKGTEGIPFSMIWNATAFAVGPWIWFILLEFLFIAVALWLLNPAARTIILMHGGFLLMLCFFSGGWLNDLLMRASIPALGVLAIYAANTIVSTRYDARKIPVLILFLAGLATPLGEIWRGVTSSRLNGMDKISIPAIVGEQEILRPQYLVRSKEEIKVLPPVFNEGNLKFAPFGLADFDFKLRRVSSDSFVDAGMTSQIMVLPAGYYKLAATLDWDAAAQAPGKNAGHISLHSARILIPIMESRENNKSVWCYFQSDGTPFRISFGLGGWAAGKGFVELKKIEISPVRPYE